MDQEELKYNEAIERVYDITSKLKPPGMDTNIIGDTLRTVMNMSRVKESLITVDNDDTSKVGSHVRNILDMDEVKDILANMRQSHNPTPQDTLKKYISKLRSKIEVAERLLLDPSITLKQVDQFINDEDDVDDDLLSLVLSGREDDGRIDTIANMAMDMAEATTSDKPLDCMFSVLLNMSSRTSQDGTTTDIQEIEEINDHSTDVEDIIDEVD